MRTSILVSAFLFFVLILFVFFSRVNLLAPVIRGGLEPDFVLENSRIDHFIQGRRGFKVNAHRIEVYKRELQMQLSVIEFPDGSVLSANRMQANLGLSEIRAHGQVSLKSRGITYLGEDILYYVKEKRFFGYNGGQLRIL